MNRMPASKIVNSHQHQQRQQLLPKLLPSSLTQHTAPPRLFHSSPLRQKGSLREGAAGEAVENRVTLFLFLSLLQTLRACGKGGVHRADGVGVRLDGGAVVGEQAVHLVLHIGQLGVHQRRKPFLQLRQHRAQLQLFVAGGQLLPGSWPCRSRRSCGAARAPAWAMQCRRIRSAPRRGSGAHPQRVEIVVQGLHPRRPDRTSRWPRPQDGYRPACGWPALPRRHRTVPSPH